MKLQDALTPLVHCIRNYASRNQVQSILLDFPGELCSELLMVGLANPKDVHTIAGMAV